jgi:pyruvate formate lyase activating enzyme
MRRALFAQPLGSGQVECRLCPHYCRLAPGQTGLCGVRHNAGGELLTSSYGRPVLLAVEPIEKKYLFHAFPGSRTLSLGTAGCNLGCRYCINWRVSQPGAEPPRAAAVVPPAEVVRRAVAEGVRCVAFTYTEPTIFFEYAEEIALLARAAGLAVVAKSNGYMAPAVLRRMAGWLDAVNIDLKAWRDEPHRRVVGGEVGPVLENLRLAVRLGLWLEVSTLIVPGVNDAAADLEAAARFLAAELGPDTPWHLLRFYPHYEMRDRPATPAPVLQTAADSARRNGLRYVYTKELARGRMLHTACPGCGTVVLEREAYGLTASHLRDGRCPTCARPLPGVGLRPAGPATPRTIARRACDASAT